MSTTHSNHTVPIKISTHAHLRFSTRLSLTRKSELLTLIRHARTLGVPIHTLTIQNFPYYQSHSNLTYPEFLSLKNRTYLKSNATKAYYYKSHIFIFEGKSSKTLTTVYPINISPYEHLKQPPVF